MKNIIGHTVLRAEKDNMTLKEIDLKGKAKMFIEKNCITVLGTRFELVNCPVLTDDGEETGDMELRWRKFESNDEDYDYIVPESVNGPMDGWEFLPNTFVSVDDQVASCPILMIEKGERMLEIYKNDDWDVTARINCNGDWDHVHNYDDLNFLEHSDDDEMIRQSKEI